MLLLLLLLLVFLDLKQGMCSCRSHHHTYLLPHFLAPCHSSSVMQSLILVLYLLAPTSFLLPLLFFSILERTMDWPFDRHLWLHEVITEAVATPDVALMLFICVCRLYLPACHWSSFGLVYLFLCSCV